LPASVLERAAAVLRVLGHAHRLRIVELLSGQDLTVGELAEVIGIAPHACSQHLNLMKAHGLLASTREGKRIHYRVINPNALSVIECIRKHAC
jgi:DNA-binding transcriptional ArsR family regulator